MLCPKPKLFVPCSFYRWYWLLDESLGPWKVNLRIVLINVPQNSETDVMTPPCHDCFLTDGIFQAPCHPDIFFFSGCLVLPFKLWPKLNTVPPEFSYSWWECYFLKKKKDPKTQKCKNTLVNITILYALSMYRKGHFWTWTFTLSVSFCVCFLISRGGKATSVCRAVTCVRDPDMEGESLATWIQGVGGFKSLCGVAVFVLSMNWLISAFYAHLSVLGLCGWPLPCYRSMWM